MLSRVAAVKAPRTHNRRRVTGSSGRRRGGRESEPQRPNMSRHVFTSAVLLLLVIMMCCGSGAVGAGRWEGVRVSGSRFRLANWGFPHVCFFSTASCGSQAVEWERI
ncbi:trans-sialidase [Trypanosoma cruzi]|nr:trans-sialidase [Trypanosoma cruzi]